MPALLEATFDGVFASGFAFSFYEDGEGAGHEERLRGRTAELIVTMDMPGGCTDGSIESPERTRSKRSTPGFAGIRTTRVTPFGSVKDSTPARRNRWLEKATRLGRSLADGSEYRPGRLKRRPVTSLKTLRPGFSPMAWVGYTMGALTALVAVRRHLLAVVPDAYGQLVWPCIPHALGLVGLLYVNLDADEEPYRIDG